MSDSRSWRQRWAQKLLGRVPPAWLSEQQVTELRAVPDDLWQQTLTSYPFLAWRSPTDLQRLRDLCALFLARKQFTPAGGLDLTDEMAVAIAAQACLPALHHGLGVYDRFVGVVVHPGLIVAPRTEYDEHTGVVHHYQEVLAGETMPGGPITLSWQDVAQAQQMSAMTGQPYNVVIHEFAHALDMADGDANGMPRLPAHLSGRHWEDTLWQAFDHLSEALAHGEPIWLDPYAVEDGLVEFFPVITEAFFVAPKKLQAAHPEVYRLLSEYFMDNPAHWESPREPAVT